jgi:hypothetical protein
MTIEKWIKESKKLSKNSTVLFDESFLTFKIGAYRASLIFSYLGFLTIIKEIILASKKPNPIPQSRWDKILFELKNEDTWEKRVYDELANSSKPIFNINDSIRQQVKYWKDRRNDCAHFKQNEINHNHTELFWSFIKSNLLKITIEGGMENLIKKFEIHFDTTQTPLDKDYSNLIYEIENSVENSQLNEFYQRLDQIENFIFSEKHYDIYSEIFRLVKNETIIEDLIKYLKTSKKDLKFIVKHPNQINAMDFSATEIRRIWKARTISDNYRFEIYASLLQNNLIPKDEKNEAIKALYDNFDQRRHVNLPQDENVRNNIAISELVSIIESDVFESNKITEDYLYVNSKSDFIVLAIEFLPLSTIMITGICEMYKCDEKSWWLNNSLLEMFKQKPNIKTQFQEVVNENGLDIPANFE